MTTPRKKNDHQAVLPTAPGARRDLLLLALWFGFVTGYGEVALHLAKKYLLGHIVFLSQHYLWMTPLTDVIIFSLVGGILAIIASLAPKQKLGKPAVFIYIFLALATLYLNIPKIHWLAFLVMAAGLSYQGMIIIESGWKKAYPLIRFTLPLLAALLPLNFLLAKLVLR